MIHYLQRVGWLFLSVQWFESIQKLGVDTEYPLNVTCYHQVAVISWQAVELHRIQKTFIRLCSCLKVICTNCFVWEEGMDKHGSSRAVQQLLLI